MRAAIKTAKVNLKFIDSFVNGELLLSLVIPGIAIPEADVCTKLVAVVNNIINDSKSNFDFVVGWF